MCAPNSKSFKVPEAKTKRTESITEIHNYSLRFQDHPYSRQNEEKKNSVQTQKT